MNVKSKYRHELSHQKLLQISTSHGCIFLKFPFIIHLFNADSFSLRDFGIRI